MITLADIQRRALGRYRQRLQEIASSGIAYEPYRITGVGDNKSTADARIRALQELKEGAASGYRIELEPPKPGSRVQQSRVKALVFDTEEALAQFLGKSEELAAFKNDIALIREKFPELLPWCADHTSEVVKAHPQWPKLLAVTAFFRNNPAPDLPVRLLPVEGIDTKFIESHNTVLCSLLDAILPEEAIDKRHSRFARRYKLPEFDPLIECFWNDPGLEKHFLGFHSLAFPAGEFARIPLPSDRIFIVENKTSIRQLLRQPLNGAVVIWGMGYGAALLQTAEWIHNKTLHYWGDLDPHGLAILSQVRKAFPHVQPLYMDRATLDTYAQALTPCATWRGAAPKHLTAEELKLFHWLVEKGEGLEQERVELKFLGYN